MKIECPKCHKKYKVEDYYIPVGGAPIKCPNCGNIFGVYVEPIDVPLEPIVEEKIEEKEEQKIEKKVENNEGELGAMFKAAQEQSTQDTFDYGNIEPNTDTTETELGNMLNAREENTNEPSLQSQPEPAKPETPDLGIFTQPEPAKPETPDLGIFTQPEPAKPETPDLGAFTQPEPTKPETPDLGSFTQPEPAKPETPDLGAFTQPEQPKPETPDLGIFTQPEPAKPETPDLGAFTQPEPTKPETKTVKRKVGAGMFESLLAGFSLPENFKNLSPDIQKKHKNAIRLARQLAKDIMLYHKEEVEKGLQNGNLKELLGEEIKRSYEFYKQRVEPEISQTTNYFIEALNKIIGKGNKVF